MIEGLIALDPLLIGDLLWTPLLIVLLKVVVIFVVGLVSTMFMVWFERKIIAGMQNRVGPNKAGPFGILQTLADGVKLFFKEDLLPDKADGGVFRLAPYLAFVPAFLVWAVIPLGGDFGNGSDGIVIWFGEPTRVQLADPPIGILLVLAVSSIAVYGHMLAGWASGSKYPLLGAVRATAQMISYEAALGLSLAAVILTAGTLSTAGIVTEQDTLSNWNIVATAVVPFIIFMIAVTAELNRPPFDLVEAEQELVGGFNTEYSSIRFGLFFLAEFMGTITMSAVIVTLFLGGPQPIAFGDTTLDIPLVPNGLEGTVWFLLKTFLFLYIYVWLRATLPRLRYDQLMDLGWKLLIPIALGWFLLLAAIRIGRDNDWDTRVVIAITLAALAASYVLMLWALRVSQRNRERAKERSSDEVERLMGYFEGFGVTLRQHRLFGGKRVTAPYSGGRVARKVVSRRHGKRKHGEGPRSTEPLAAPDTADDVKADKPPRLHGRHVLGRYEDGMEKCIGCELCAGVCPAQCIYVRGADNDADNPTSPGERYGFVYEINYLRCIHCDLCVEACPTEAITESKLFEFSFTSRDDAIYTKTELLVGDDGRPQHLPWEDWREGEDADTSGWVRATAPSGDADFIGLVGWSAELGYGVRAPEPPQEVTDASDVAIPDPSVPKSAPTGQSSADASAAEAG